MKGRIYDPLAGRFTTADPVTQAPYWSQGLNRYSYVFNDPVNNTDPSGFMANGGDSTFGIMGWGAGVVGLAVAQGSGLGAAFGGLGAGANLGSWALSSHFGGPSLGGGKPGSSRDVPTSGAPSGNGVSNLSPQAKAATTGSINELALPDASVPDWVRGPDQRTACYPACATDPDATFGPNTAARDAYKKGYEIVAGGLLNVGGLARLALERLAFSAVERLVIQEVRAIPLQALRAAYEAGGAELQIAGRTILVDPGVPASGMTLFGENGFILGKEAFASDAELTKTLLHETYRLATSQSAGGVSGALATSETNAAWSFAERAYNWISK